MVLNFGPPIGHAIRPPPLPQDPPRRSGRVGNDRRAAPLAQPRPHHPEDFAAWRISSCAYGPNPAVQGRRHASAAGPPAGRPHSRKRAQWPPRLVPLATGIGRTEVVYDVTDAELLAAPKPCLRPARYNQYRTAHLSGENDIDIETLASRVGLGCVLHCRSSSVQLSHFHSSRGKSRGHRLHARAAAQR